ncbi:MAG: primase-helicase family protein [Paracoccaceae bacterium]
MDNYSTTPNSGCEPEMNQQYEVMNSAATAVINDATVFGDLNSPEAQAVLKNELITGFATRAPKVAGDKWIQRRFPFSIYMEVLTQHPVSKKKEGSAFFFSETALTGRSFTENGDKQLYTFRAKAKALSVTAFVIDIDGTDSIDRVRDQLIEMGLFGVLYTTHSHARKASPDGDYFRVIIPLERPFSVSEFGGSVRQASAEWLARYAGFADALGIEDLDLSAAKFVQMMYLPRRTTKDAEFKHYVVAGRALSIEEMPVDPDVKLTGRTPNRAGTTDRAKSGSSAPAVLSDGFDVREWFSDCGAAFDVDLFLECIGLDIRDPAAGDGMTIMCPNHMEHSDPDDGSDMGCWCCPTDGDKSFLIYCHHDHCSELNTWDFICKIEERIEDGDAVLPDEYSSLSEMLCDDLFYPEIDGQTICVHPTDYGAEQSIDIPFLGSPKKVEDAFQTVKNNNHAGDTDLAALFAGVAKAGNKSAALKRLEQLFSEDGCFNKNEVSRLKSLAKKMAASAAEAAASKTKSEIRDEALAALESGVDDKAHPSWDIAAPLGDKMSEAIATLNKRWRVVSVGGKVRFLRVPDPANLSAHSPTLETMSKGEFELYHANRCVMVGETPKNPASVFVDLAQRYSAIEFSPPPKNTAENGYNLYRGRQMHAVKGDSEPLKEFIRDVVCGGRDAVFDFVWLHMAHTVQYPGDKPQTAIVLRGKGGCGKSTFGLIFERLAAPYSLTISEGEHVTGRFAGQHLSTAIVAVCTEALFAGDPKVNGKIKNLVTAESILVEPKGLPPINMPSYTRFIFDSNDERVVPIDGNGSERRYLVMEISDAHKDDHKYFDRIYAEIEGDGLPALLWELENYRPEDHGQKWSDLRTAPDTPERRKMHWHTTSRVKRAMVRMIEEGGVTMKTESGQTFRYNFETGEPFRLPQSELRRFLRGSMNEYDAKDGDIPEMMSDLFGETVFDEDGQEYATCAKNRGPIECEEYSTELEGDDWNAVKRKGVRYFEFAPVELLRAASKGRFDRGDQDDA